MENSVAATAGEIVDAMAGATPTVSETTTAAAEDTPAAATGAKEESKDTQKQLLIKLIAQRGNVSPTEARAWFDTVFAVVAEAIVLLNKVTITGFGTFRAKEIKARIGRNPRTGEAVNIPKSVRLSFKAGKTTKATLQAAAGGSPAKRERVVSAQDEVRKARAAVKKAVAKKVKKAIVKKAVKKVVRKQTAKKEVRKKAGKAKQ